MYKKAFNNIFLQRHRIDQIAWQLHERCVVEKLCTFTNLGHDVKNTISFPIHFLSIHITLIYND